MNKKIQEFFKMKAEKKGDENEGQSELDKLFEKYEGLTIFNFLIYI